MGDTLNTVVEILAERGEVDNRATFDALWRIMSDQQSRIAERFDLTEDPGYDGLRTYEGSGEEGEGWSGELNLSSGPEVDWLVHSWMGNPATGFTNMHLTCWLGPQVDVPHLAFAWGTLPDLWFYMDYLPRRDLQVDYDHLQRYWQPTNERFLALKADEGLSYFTSRTLVVRQHVSHTGYCFTCPDAQTGNRAARIAQIAELAEERVTEWFGMLDAADAVPAAQRDALAARDEHVRRTIAETDPANVLGERFFGAELTERLVGALWGAERQNPRPT